MSQHPVQIAERGSATHNTPRRRVGEGFLAEFRHPKSLRVADPCSDP